MKTFALNAVLSALPLLARAATTPDKATAVRNALTNVDKINALTDDEFVFDFKDPNLKKVTGAGGTLTSANVGNFAALVGNGLALTIGEMAACGINSPHTHPRATEVLLLLNGELTSGFLTENGSRLVLNNLTEYSAMVFPAGSIHFQANFGCEPVKFVAALSNEDPGTLQVAQRYFALPADVVGASLGGLGVQEIEDLASKIPDNVIAGTKECYQRCNIPYPENQPTKQQQPKPSGTTSQVAPQPTETYAPAPPPAGGNVIDVIVGKDNGLTFTADGIEDGIEAPVGSTVRFTFVSKNHTVTQSSFAKPCEAAEYGFDSGFMPIPAGSNDFKTYEVKITDDKPIWFYCKQRPAGAKSHCSNGMNGVINAPKSGPNTLEEFKKLAAQST